MSDPVKVIKLVQAVCDACGWHTAPVESTGGGTRAAESWARIHRVACPASISGALVSAAREGENTNG